MPCKRVVKAWGEYPVFHTLLVVCLSTDGEPPELGYFKLSTVVSNTPATKNGRAFKRDRFLIASLKTRPFLVAGVLKWMIRVKIDKPKYSV